MGGPARGWRDNSLSDDALGESSRINRFTRRVPNRHTLESQIADASHPGFRVFSAGNCAVIRRKPFANYRLLVHEPNQHICRRPDSHVILTRRFLLEIAGHAGGGRRAVWRAARARSRTNPGADAHPEHACDNACVLSRAEPGDRNVHHRVCRPDRALYLAGDYLTYSTAWMQRALQSGRAVTEAIRARASEVGTHAA